MTRSSLPSYCEAHVAGWYDHCEAVRMVENGDPSGSLERVEQTVELRRRELKEAARRAHTLLTAAGFTSGKMAELTGFGAGQFRKLIADGDRSGWAPPSLSYCQAIDQVGRDELQADLNLARMREALDRARELLRSQQAVHRQRSSSDALTEARHDLLADSVKAYLQALDRVLRTTSPWLPYTDLDRGFENRSVSVSRTPPAPGEPDRLYDDSWSLPRGNVTWRSAILEVAIAVVLADAGFGKSWLLRHHAMQLCAEALQALNSGADVEDLHLPLWMHASDLSTAWSNRGQPATAVVEAALRQPTLAGFVPDGDFRKLLALRIDASAEPVTVMVDGYDEVVDHRARVHVVQALRWLGDLVRHPTGPRTILASRASGYSDPFGRSEQQGDEPADDLLRPHYLQLGVLEEFQVRHLWQAWFAAKETAVPIDRLQATFAPGSPLRRYVRVPLIAAFCAWVAETEPVLPSRTELYGQVVDRFLAQSWKQDEPSPTAMSAADGARREQLKSALVELAWGMSVTDKRWRDLIPVGECEGQLQSSGIHPLPGRSLTWEAVRQIGILVQPGAIQRAGLGDADVMWIHRSVHEYLAALHLHSMPTEDVEALLETTVWFHPGWANVLDFALGLESHRSTGSPRSVAPSLSKQALAKPDPLGWFTTVLASPEVASVEELKLPIAVRDRAINLYKAGILTSPQLARVLAADSSPELARTIELLCDDLSTGAVKKEIWDALIWCGPLGREKLADLICTSHEAIGAASALLSVDARAAVAALSARLRSGLNVSVTDEPVLRLLEPDVSSLVIDRYVEQPESIDRARLVGWCHTDAGYAALTTDSTLRSESPNIRRAALIGLSDWYGLDLDRRGFEILSDSALEDPDPGIRILARGNLESKQLYVPWIFEAMSSLLTDLHEDDTLPEMTTLQSLAARLEQVGPATRKVVIMLREEPRLLRGPIPAVMADLTARALTGDLEVELTAEIARLVGEDFTSMASRRLREAQLDDSSDYFNLAVGASLADPSSEELYDAMVDCVENCPSHMLRLAMELHGTPIEDRINSLLLKMSSLSHPAPGSVRVWMDTVRNLLMKIPHHERLPFLTACASTTDHLLSLTEEDQ